MALSPTLRTAKSHLGVARKAEIKALRAAQADPNEKMHAAAREATQAAETTRVAYEVERALVSLLAISGETTREQRRRLSTAVRDTTAGGRT